MKLPQGHDYRRGGSGSRCTRNPAGRMRPKHLVLLVACLWAFLALGPARGAEALRGVALVVGNGAYETLPALPNPPNDAHALEALLGQLGFETDLVTDRKAKRLKRDLDDFAEDASGADVAVLYYSGHGIEAGGENFLVPVDADLSALDDAGDKLVPLTPLLAKLQASVPITIVILDACRNSPFPPNAPVRLDPAAAPVPVASVGLSEPSRGAVSLVTTEAPQAAAGKSLGTVIAFAAAPGKAALDGPAGGNSPFAAALLKHLGAGDAGFSDIMTMVTEEVYLDTKTQQRPWVNASLRRLLYFGKRVEEPAGDEAALRGARRSLLLTISATPADTRSFVETLASRDDLPLDQLYGMLKELHVDTSAGAGALQQQLQAGAENLRKFMAERVEPIRTDPELVRLSTLADRAQGEGAIGLAKEFRAKASARADTLSQTLDEREGELKADRLQLAATYSAHAETAVLAFDYRTAAGRFGDAYAQAEKWDAQAALFYRISQADALSNLGQNSGDNDALQQAVSLYREALQQAPRATAPDQWATIQNNMGAALWILGKREGSSARLEEAAAADRLVLEVWTQAQAPEKWAAAANNLGSVLVELAERDAGVARLQEAVAVLQSVLRSGAMEGDPYTKGMALNNLGNALSALGHRSEGAADYTDAIAAYRSALTALPRATFPLEWAMAENNLGNALQSVGQGKNDKDSLRQAEAAFRSALEERTRERAPADWANTQNNLGNTLQLLAAYDDGTERLDEALATFHSVLEEWTRAKNPMDWAAAQNNIANVLLLLWARDGSRAHLDEAIAAVQAALEEWTADAAPQQWAMAQGNLGNLLKLKGEDEEGPESLQAAAQAYRNVLLVRTRDAAPLGWAGAQASLGGLQRMIGERTGDKDQLAYSLQTLSAALDELAKDEANSLAWAEAMDEFGRTFLAMAKLDADPAWADNAVKSFQAVLGVETKASDPEAWAAAQSGLGDALRTDAAKTDNETAKLHEAVSAYDAALEVRAEGRDSLAWAETLQGLGLTFQMLGQRESDPAWLQASVEAFEHALSVQTRENAPQNWGRTQSGLGYTLLLQADAETGTDKLQKAANAFRAALTVLSPQKSLMDWSDARTSLGLTLVELGDRLNAQGVAAGGRAEIAATWKALQDAGDSRFDDYFTGQLADADKVLARLGQAREGGK